MISQDVRQIVNAYSRVVTSLKKSVLLFIFSGYRSMALAVNSLERMIIKIVMDHILTPIKQATDDTFREK